MIRSCAIISNQAFSILNFRGSLIRELIAAGVKVYTLAPDYDDGLRVKIAALGAIPLDFGLARTGMNPLRDGIDTLMLWMLLRRLRPDVTLGYFAKPVIYGTLAAWLARVPRRIAMIEGLGYVFTISKKRLSKRDRFLKFVVSVLYRWSLTRAHKVIFLNSDDLSEFIADGLVHEKQCVKLGGIGVDLGEWPVAPVHVAPLTFLLAARLLREKGIVEYVEAARLIKARHPGVRFVLLGGLDSNPGGLCRAEVQAWADEGLLEWPGHVAVQPWLAQASVYVLPSYYREGLPRSTQEAMAMGRPVITTDAPGCRETVQDGVNGFMVPVRDVPALAKAMLTFVDKPELIESMGRESRRLAELHFDARKINVQLLNILGVK